MICKKHRRVYLVCLLHSILLLASANPLLAADEKAVRGKIESKILLIQKYLESRTADEIASSDSVEANDLMIRTRELVEQAVSDLDEGKLEDAEAGVDQSIKLFTAAAESVRRQKQTNQQNLIEIESVKAEIDAYMESYQAALVSRGAAVDGPLDQVKLVGMLSDADKLRSNGDIESARAILIETRKLVVAALIAVRNNETLVYRVEFETPADEFVYEQHRYLEYVKLGQHVLDNGDFDASRVKLFQQLNEAGNVLSREAIVWVEEGDYTSGINRMQAATNKVVQGLQLLGIPLAMQ